MERKAFLDRIASLEGKEKYDAILDYSRFLRQIDPKESVLQAKSLLQPARESDDSKFLLGVITYIATSYIYCSDDVHAEYWLEILKEKGEQFNVPKALGDYYNMKARLQYKKDDTLATMKLLLKALEHYLKTDSGADKISCYNALGIMHLDMEELDKSKDYLWLALETAVLYNSPAQHSIRLNISNILFRQEKYQEVIEINEQSLGFFRENEMLIQEATALGNIGLCYTNLKDYDKGIEYLQKAIEIDRRMNDLRNLASNIVSISGAYIESKNPEGAKSYLVEAFKISKEHKFRSDLVGVYRSCANYYETIGDLKRSNKYLRKMHNRYVEVTKESQQKELKELEEKYNTQIYKLSNEELKQSNQAMTKQLSEMNEALNRQQSVYLKLQENFQTATAKMNQQDNLLTVQARMAVMGEMLSSIAHQWKQPLNVIWILTQAIMDAWEYDELSDDFIMNQTKKIGEQIDYMSETINDFRNFFKENYQNNYKVSEVIRKSVSLVSYMMKQSGIVIKKKMDKTCTLSGNPNELSQVLINILNNARQAIEESSPPERLVKISLECNSDSLSIRIFNTGNHISDENMEKLFLPYFTTKGETGTGIGLNICQHIIKNKYNGEIRAANIEDGVEFIIDISQPKKD